MEGCSSAAQLWWDAIRLNAQTAGLIPFLALSREPVCLVPSNMTSSVCAWLEIISRSSGYLLLVEGIVYTL